MQKVLMYMVTNLIEDDKLTDVDTSYSKLRSDIIDFVNKIVEVAKL